MPNKKINPKLLWMQFEDVLAPRLGLTVWDRAVYSYLLRHSLVVGKFRLHFSVISVARDLNLSNGPVRQAVRRLDELGALRLLERSKTGHLVEMRLPEQIPALRTGNDVISARRSFTLRAGEGALVYRERSQRATHLSRAKSRDHFRNAIFQADGEQPACDLDSIDFLKTWALRKAIHARERGACFYCLRSTPANVRCLDHVVPRVRFGRNSYRNLVSCCLECNTRKGGMSAPDFLRILYRKGRLTAKELDGRLLVLKDLAAGNLRPSLPSM